MNLGRPTNHATPAVFPLPGGTMQETPKPDPRTEPQQEDLLPARSPFRRRAPALKKRGVTFYTLQKNFTLPLSSIPRTSWSNRFFD
ncbi:MAG: hypothetical protein DRH20_08945 [Deltaproteobacteria bacterium]|nr:MAG: hypothetical protein DRH20_08945 [Deltaproteobacteria bacterium]